MKIIKLFLICSFLLCLYVLIVDRYSQGVLIPQYNDHLRHLRYAWEFLHRGLSIYTTPMKELERIGNPLAYSWLDSPYPYPLGAIIFYLPFSCLLYLSVLPETLIYKTIIAIFILFSHVDTYLLYKKLRQVGMNIALRFLFSLSFYLTVLVWSFSAQYESIVLFIIILSTYARNKDKAIFLLSLSTFIKFQALLVFPFYLAELVASYKQYKFNIFKNIYLVFSLLFIIGDIITIKVLGNSICPIMQNPIYYRNHSHELLVIFAMTLCFLIYMLFGGNNDRERYLYVSSIALIFISFSSVCVLQQWYLLFLFPVALLIRSEQIRDLYALYTILFYHFLGWLPNVYYIINLFIKVPKDL